MKQRLFGTLTVSALLAFALTACDQGNEEDTRQPGGMQNSEPAQLGEQPSRSEGDRSE